MHTEILALTTIIGVLAIAGLALIGRMYGRAEKTKGKAELSDSEFFDALNAELEAGRDPAKQRAREIDWQARVDAWKSSNSKLGRITKI